MLLTRPLVTAGISFLTTALVVSFFSLKVSLLIITAFIFLLLLVLVIFNGKKRIGIAVILISSIFAGCSYLIFASNEYDLSNFDSQTSVITGVVTDIAPARNSKTAYTLKITDSTIKDMPTGFKAILYAKSDVLIDFYDTIQIEAKARKITSSPSFNSEQYYRAIGIYAAFSSYSQAKIVQSNNHNIMYYAKQINAVCGDSIDRYVERPYSGLVKAMLLGNKNDIDDIAYNSITRSGVSHIFVVSGLHISLLIMMLFFILNLMGLSLRVRSIVSIFATWGFVAITGFGLPAIRAAIMLTVLMGANLFRRKSDSLTSLFLAGIIIVLINPISIVNASFLLTFTATSGIILFARPISNFLCRTFNIKSKFMRYIVNIIAVTLAANLTMFPVIIYIFKGISVVAPIVNIVVVPILPVILIVGILLICFSGVPFVTSFLGSIIKILLAIILKTCEIASSINFAYIGLNYKFVYIWLSVTIILIVIATALIKQKQVTLNVLFISFAGLILCFGFNSAYNRDNVQITTLNSFEAQSVVITYNSRATVIAFDDDGRLDVDAENFLRSKNIHKIENYIFTSGERKDIADTEFLTETTDTYNVYLMDNDKLLPYSKDSFKPINGIFPLKLNGGYDILNSKGTRMFVDRFDNGVIVSLIVGQTKIAITNSAEIASKADCEIIFFCGEYNEILTQNRARCVILLSRFELDRLADKFDSVKAYEKQISVTVRQNGAYRIGV